MLAIIPVQTRSMKSSNRRFSAKGLESVSCPVTVGSAVSESALLTWPASSVSFRCSDGMLLSFRSFEVEDSSGIEPSPRRCEAKAGRRIK